MVWRPCSFNKNRRASPRAMERSLASGTFYPIENGVLQLDAHGSQAQNAKVRCGEPASRPKEHIHIFHIVLVKASRGFEARSLDSESRVLTVTPRDHLGLRSFVLVQLTLQWRTWWVCSEGQHWAHMLFQALSWSKSGPEQRTNKKKARRLAQKHKK